MPAAGAQFPVFISLFYMLRTDLRRDICGTAHRPRRHEVGDADRRAQLPDAERRGDFLFVPDLTAKAHRRRADRADVLYVGSQLLSTLLMSVDAGPQPADDHASALPFVFVIFV